MLFTRKNQIIVLMTVILSLVICSVKSSDPMGKSSLTFVIDDTGSMHNEIAQVKEGAKSIFDTVMNSKASQIEDFVLVTFNDPEITYRTTTKDLDAFRNALDSINVDGGDDCAEMCMTGIEKALVESRPGSLVYVFTDASAKDHHKFEDVKALAQKKLSQIVFVLTGICEEGQDHPSYQAYEGLAAATSGQVFHLDRKDEINKVLKYVEDSIKSRKTVIVNKSFPPGPNTFTYEVDGKMKELVISVSGRDPSVSVTRPDGSPAATEDIIRTTTIAVVKVTEVKPGVYTAEVDSRTNTSVVVTGTTSVHFQYGFSQLKPMSISGTATRPVPDTKSYVAVQLTIEGGDIRLQTLQIRDMDDKIVTEVPFKVTADHKKHFYVTDKIDLPNDMFKVAIKGYDFESKTAITRISLTPIAPQRVEVPRTKSAPNVTVVGKTHAQVDYGQSLELRCKINAYPKADVVWEDTKGNKSPSEPTLLEFPSDYISVFKVDTLHENNTFTCRATNALGTDAKKIDVVVNAGFRTVEKPTSADIPINGKATFNCTVDAKPPAAIQWYKDGHRLETSSHFKIASEGSTLTIHNMQPELSGSYLCAVRHPYENHDFHFYVGITGIEPPVVDKKTNEIRVLEGSNAEIVCRLLEGKPQPKLSWFFQHLPEEETVEVDAKGKNYINLRNVTSKMSGTYRCKAHNSGGDDFHYVDLIVEHRPTITRCDRSEMLTREGEMVRIRCIVDGEPTPEVKWYINNTEIRESRFHVHKNSLSFKARVEDSGFYKCEATNIHGTATQITEVSIIIPARIESPKNRLFEVMVGDSLTLPCEADGFPKPKIKWVFYSVNPRTTPRIITKYDPSGSLSLRLIQINEDGYYQCEASNIGNSSSIFYRVTVLAPPQIKKTYPESTFRAVVGDRVLRIHCEATGRPQPYYIWSHDELGVIAAGTEWYDIDNGTLIIKNIDKNSAGNYTCEAVNKLGKDVETFEVDVDPYPRPASSGSTIFIELGNSSDVQCRIPHKITDSLRWYKDGRVIANNELRLEKVKLSDAGIYTCRVSTFEKSRNANVEVRVGYKPRFSYEEKTQIDFEEGRLAVLDCTSEGDPVPEITWWHNGKQIPFDGMIYTFTMRAASIGKYTCLVKNNFGNVHRQFELASRDCMINIETDFDERQPLMVTYDLQWPSFERVGDLIKIPTGELIVLFCPNGFENFDENEITITCESDNRFAYSRDSYNFDKFKCRNEIVPVIRKKRDSCSSGNTTAYGVGYEIREEFLEVYQICFDNLKKIPHYAMQTISSDIASLELKKDSWYPNELIPYGFDAMYNCDLQLRTISSTLLQWFHQDDKCCFGRMQLVNSQDVLPGLSQTATFSYLNLIPQWSTCNTKNWHNIEKLIRELAKSSTRELKVWTGTAEQLQISGKDIIISDQYSRIQPVPKFLWKVVQDPEYEESVAIIFVNVPDLNYTEALKMMRCRDFCSEIEWLGERSWRDVSNGFIYCCNIKEFEVRFGLGDIFNSGAGKLFYKNLSVTSDRSLLD